MNRPNSTCLAALLMGALALGGCVTTHVGDDWQCPLTQGSPCLTVSAADPATGVGAGARQQVADAPTSLDSARSTGRRPAGRSPSAGRRPGPAFRSVGNASESDSTRTADGSAGGAARCNAWCRPFAWLWRRGGDDSTAEDADSAGESAAEGDVEPVPAPAGTQDDLRTPEVVGRVWIAPYVDANGVYREASWVRAVLEPSRWRLP